MIEEKVLESFKDKSVLVTGGTGLIGRQVVDILAYAGANIKIVSLDTIRLNYKVEHVFGDLTNFDFCKKVTKDMDYVFHMAGIGASVKAAEKYIATHFVPMLMMNTNVLEASRINKVKKIVYTSSVGAYPNAEVFKESDYELDTIPMDFAGWAKRITELQIYAYKIEHRLDNFSIVRPSNVYGPGDNFNPVNSLVIPSLLYRIYHKQFPVVIWGDGSAIRDFVYSRDVAEGIILALYYGTRSSFVNLGSGKPCSVKELVETLHTVVDFEYVFDPSKPRGAAKRIMDISLAKKIINYNPTTDLKEGLKKTWDWFISNPEEHNKKHNYFNKTD